MHLPRSQILAALAAAIAVGAGGGVAIYAAATSNTRTVVRQVTVDNASPASSTSSLSIGQIYKRSDKLAVGDGVVAIGSPFGLEETVTSGIVSALHREMTSPNRFTIPDSIQTDAAINHGNSGGPLLDLSGHVIGVNAQIESDSGGNDGVGFAIPSKTVKSVVSGLLANGKVEHAFLGVSS